MVREILQISVGQCGNQIGRVFWQNILEEHEIDYNGKFYGNDIRKVEKLDVYMREIDTSKNKKQTIYEIIDKNENAIMNSPNANKLVPQHIRYVPRSVLLDLEPGVIDSIRASPIGNLFAPDYMVNAVSGAGNNWAKGHYVAGAEIIDEAMDCVRRYVEDSDCLQGFQLTQALGGGTGSGFGTLVLNKLRDLYPDRINCTYSVYPAPKVSDIVVEPYNALLSISHLMETSDETFVIDNQSLIQISDKILKQTNPNFSDLNWIISLIMSGVTASLRFSGILNGDLRKIATNLVPFPRLHFFSCSFAPLFQKGKSQYTNWSFRQITEDIWRDDHFLADIHAIDGKWLSCCINYRGSPQDTSSYVIDNTIKEFQLKNEDTFVRWIPNNVKTSVITVPPNDINKCASLISNTTSIKSVFMRISAQFASLFKRRAFLHWYTNEGMDEMEFIDSDAQIRDLIFEYQEKQDAIYTTPSPPSTDSEEFEYKIKSKTEDEKAQAFIARKLKKIEKQMKREQQEREFAEKNKNKTVFGNIHNIKKRPPSFKNKSKIKHKPKSNPGGQKEKKRAAIIWSDDENDDDDDFLNDDDDFLDDDLDQTENDIEDENQTETDTEHDNHIDQQDQQNDENFDENDQNYEHDEHDENYDENDENYDENDENDEHYDENDENYDENDENYEEEYDENGHYDENGDYENDENYQDEEHDENYDPVYDENYDGVYDENYDEEEVEQVEEEIVKKKKKKKKGKDKVVKKEENNDDLAFLDSD